MLILTRRFGESIIIGDGIVVTVISAREGQIRLGIEAPADVAVDRSELRLRKLAYPEGPGVRHVSN